MNELYLKYSLKAKECPIGKNKLFKNEKELSHIFEISKPIFDNKSEHSIVEFITSSSLSPESISGSSFFLKKVYGKWVIVEEFDYWEWPSKK